MFEKASRLKLRFETPKGDLSVEELWDLPLQTKIAHGLSLDNLAKHYNRKVKESGEESFVTTPSAKNKTLVLQLDILKHIIKTRLEENKAHREALDKKARQARIKALIEEKKDDELKGKSLEDLEKMLED